MCNISDNIERAIAFYYQFTGQKLVVKRAMPDITKRLPLMISRMYSCYSTEIMGLPILLLEVKNPEIATPIQLQKHQKFFLSQLGIHVIFVLERIASYKLSRLASAMVNFIVPGKQLFVPLLMMNMKDVKEGRVLEEEIMPGMAQCVLLYHIEHGGLSGMSARELAELFHVSYPNMSRALRWLEKKGLCELCGVKTKRLVLEDDKQKIWQMALPLMPSPVERIVYSDKCPEKTMIAGESAMGILTMLEEPQLPVVAISKAEAKAQVQRLFKHEGNFVVEIWRYDPHLLSTDATVDSLSLYLSLKDIDDERVQMELEKLIKFTK